MKDKKVFKIELDGIILNDEYPSIEAALNAARRIFQEDPSKHEANILKFAFVNTNISIRNK